VTPRSGLALRSLGIVAVALAAAGVGVACNFLIKVDDGCSRDDQCPSGQVCNVRRRFCAAPVVEQCNGVDDDADGLSDDRESWGNCQPTVGNRMCGGQRRCQQQGGRWALSCEINATEQEDICRNGIDDNCNGVVDDGADCVANFGPTRGVQIGSNNPADGEGDDAPAHQVCLTSFALDRYEVTQRQYAVFLSALAQERLRIARPTTVMNPTVTYGRYVIYRNDAGQDVNLLFLANRPGPLVLQQGIGYWRAPGDDSEELPVVGVTWFGAAMYCSWAGKQLPTEAEYFRAARGETGTRPFPWGDAAPSCERANIGVNGPDGGACVGAPLPVNALDMGRSPEGVFHLYGNANEWMYDWLDTNPTHTANNYYMSLPADPLRADDAGVRTNSWCNAHPQGPLGPTMGSPITQPENAGLYCQQCRFARGRHYRTVDTRIGIRRWLDPDRSDETVGFRCSNGGAPRMRVTP
jgi:formylglycine-generating enzyme required for sulfatase activity